MQAYFGEQVVPYFDETYYLRQNPDIAEAVARGLMASGWEHFRLFGVAEGRVASPLLDLDVYRANNPDLTDAGLTSDAELMLHFYLYGRNESRVVVSESVFDWEYYLEKNPDLAAAGILSREAAEKHFLNHGINEGRITHPTIEGASYIDKNPDIAAYVASGGTLGGLTDKAAIGIWHYLNYGLGEGRELGDPQPDAPVPVPPVPPEDDSPSVTFTVSAVGDVGEQVVTFGGNATGTITMAGDYNLGTHAYDLTFTRQGVTAASKPSSSELTINLNDGVLLSASAQYANGVNFDAVGDEQTGRVSITGYKGSQHLNGAEGDDSLAGGAGDDFLTGGAGADTFILEGSDTVTDFDSANGDTLVLSALSSVDTVTFDSVTGTLDFSKAAEGAKLVVTTTSGNSTITGGGSDDTITGGGGNDTITGGAGNDVIDGGSGTNTYVYAVVSDSTVNDVDEAATGFDTVTFISGDIFDFGDDVVTVSGVLKNGVDPENQNGDSLISALNNAFGTNLDEDAENREVMVIQFQNGQMYLVADRDADQQITANDSVVKIIGGVDSIGLIGGDVVMLEGV